MLETDTRNFHAETLQKGTINTLRTLPMKSKFPFFSNIQLKLFLLKPPRANCMNKGQSGGAETITWRNYITLLHISAKYSR